MLDKSPEPDILRHRTPPGLKRAGILAVCAAGIIVAVGIGLRYYNDSQTARYVTPATRPCNPSRC